MKTGFGSLVVRFDKAAKSESAPPERMVDRVVSKSLPPTLSLIRSLGCGPGADWEFPSSINGRKTDLELGRDQKEQEAED